VTGDGLAELLQRADLDELVREVDRRCGRGEYAEVLELRDGCRSASERLGRQLWGPAQYAEYRLALEAPGPLAAAVVVPGAGRFALGPLTEVVAQHHGFDEVADHLDAAVRPVVAQERALRGEDLGGDPRADPADVGVPAVLQPWEPVYPLPTYRAGEVLEPEPPVEIRAAGAADTGVRAAAARTVAGDRGTPTHAAGTGEATGRALRELVAPWRDESRGHVDVAVVAGGPRDALAAIGREARLLDLGVPQALARMAWAGASGGARGRRRGGAAGRAAAWWVAHAVTGLEFPADPDELEFELEELHWYAFDVPGVRTGWQLSLVVAGDGWAAAIDAHDRADAHDHDEDHDDADVHDRADAHEREDAHDHDEDHHAP
jgi:hypothetical protein